MTSTRWRLVKDLLSEAMELPRFQRPEELENDGKHSPRAIGAKNGVEIGERQREGDDLAVLFDEGNQLRNHHRLELRRQVVDFVIGHRKKAPILLPRLVIEHLDPLHLAFEFVQLERPDREAQALTDQVGCAR